MAIFLQWLLIIVLVVLVGMCLTVWRAGLKKFFREVRIEMQKVAWPSRNDVIGQTIVVLVFVAFLTICVSFFDEVLSFIMKTVLPGKGA